MTELSLAYFNLENFFSFKLKMDPQVHVINGIIHHCLDLKSRILRIYLPGNDTPTTDKGYKQEILE